MFYIPSCLGKPHLLPDCFLLSRAMIPYSVGMPRLLWVGLFFLDLWV